MSWKAWGVKRERRPENRFAGWKGRLGVPGEKKFLRKGIFYGAIQELSFVEGEDAAVIGGGNSALQVVENLHTVARNIHLISTSELTADQAVVERAGCLANLHTYLGC
jgi:thioredoxin reductase